MGVCEFIELNNKLLYGLKECQCVDALTLSLYNPNSVEQTLEGARAFERFF